MVSSLPQRIDSRRFLAWGVPSDLVHSRCVLPLIFCHSFDGNCLPAKRMGEQMLQRFHFAPSALLRCLDNTGLQPTHVRVGRSPVDGLPVHLLMGNRTSSLLLCRHLLYLLRRFFKRSCHERPSGSLLACARGAVVFRLNPYLLHYRAAFAFSTFLYPHLHRLPLRVAFPFQGEIRAYRVPLTCLSGLGSPFSPVA